MIRELQNILGNKNKYILLNWFLKLHSHAIFFNYFRLNFYILCIHKHNKGSFLFICTHKLFFSMHCVMPQSFTTWLKSQLFWETLIGCSRQIQVFFFCCCCCCLILLLCLLLEFFNSFACASYLDFKIQAQRLCHL